MITRASRRIGWLPGPADPAVEVETVLSLPYHDLDLRVPRLTAPSLARLLERVAANRDAYLAELPIERIITLIDRVASRWLDPTSPFRREAERLLPRVTGYAESAVRKGLISYLSTLRAENVRRLLDEELFDPLVLDGFRPRRNGGGETRAFGPRLTVQVWSGNVPGLPAQSLLSSLLLKSAAVGKVAAEEPLFATLLAESVAEVDPRLAECLAVVYWPGGDEALESVAFGAADAVIAYGSEQTIASVRARVKPGTRFMPYGHKLSFGAIAREALAADRVVDTADLAAYDVSKYDQQGCLSPHLLYIETGGETSPRDFSHALGQALERQAALVPRGRLEFAEAASATAARQ
ncbi:MAG TPA: acyl-CoA reductase, partial [Chloroflexota bacterium]|nr:acyl-CoA reductase [Chloroflexota bacterium]